MGIDLPSGLKTASKGRMLSDIPVRDWADCRCVPSSLNALVGIIAPGHLRKFETVFEVIGLQVLGVASVKNEADEWLIRPCTKCKRAAPCQVSLFCFCFSLWC